MNDQIEGKRQVRLRRRWRILSQLAIAPRVSAIAKSCHTRDR
jgi:hypothetical protein